MSPLFFAKYISNLIHIITQSKIGGNIGGVFYNILAYADDLILIAPSWHAMQKLLCILEAGATEIDMLCNVNKTCCMVFNPIRRNSIVCNNFKPVYK